MATTKLAGSLGLTTREVVGLAMLINLLPDTHMLRAELREVEAVLYDVCLDHTGLVPQAHIMNEGFVDLVPDPKAYEADEPGSICYTGFILDELNTHVPMDPFFRG
jgi:hypothetical protein